MSFRFFLSFILTLSFVLSAEAAKKRSRKGNPSKEAGRIFERGLKAQKAGDIHHAKKIFAKVAKNYPKTPLNDEHESDVESYEIKDVTNYGEYAKHLLKFVDMEISEGEKRTFKTSEEAMADLLNEIRTENAAEIEKSLWVGVEVKACESHGPVKPPAEAAAFLMEQIKGAGKNIKSREKPGSDPSLELTISSKKTIEIGLNRYGDGWVWNQVTYCEK